MQMKGADGLNYDTMDVGLPKGMKRTRVYKNSGLLRIINKGTSDPPGSNIF
jgi:hypothetical protein